MGVTIQIGNETRELKDANSSWINDQIARRQRDGSVCVIVTVKEPGLDLRLTTPACPSGQGGRAPYPRELEVIELWNQRKLNSGDFTGGNLVAFLHELRRLI